MASEQPTRIPATLIPGDGIGPEITEAVVAILDAIGSPFEWDRQVGGLAGIQNGGDPLPQATLESIGRTRLALKGPLTTPVGGGFRSVNVRLRESFGLYANLRPARTMLAGGRFEDIDIVLVRENLEGLYVAFERTLLSCAGGIISSATRATSASRRSSAARRRPSTKVLCRTENSHALTLPPIRKVERRS
jgi:isocitrate dehydrogenase (NAD+)